MNCAKCKNEIPAKRAELGYKVCVKCSTVESYGCVDIVYHKTGNTVEITDSKTADAINKASKRSGYGVMRGMTKGGSKSVSLYKPRGKSVGKAVSTSFVGSETTFNKVGEKAMLYFSVDGLESAIEIIDKAFQEMEINIHQVNKLKKVFESLNSI